MVPVRSKGAVAQQQGENSWQGPHPGAFEYWTAEHIAWASRSPLGAVTENWPIIHRALVRYGIGQKEVQAAAITTTAIETAHTFRPIEEYRNADGSIPSYWHGYSGGWRFHGAGYVQTTHDYNYAELGRELGVDLSEGASALVGNQWWCAVGMALFFRNHNVAYHAMQRDWTSVRRSVNGWGASAETIRNLHDLIGRLGV